MKEERLICPTTPKLSHVTERCFETKLQIYITPRNGTYIVLCTVPRIHRTLNHTDAKALIVCRHMRLWHWCGDSFSASLCRYFLELSQRSICNEILHVLLQGKL